MNYYLEVCHFSIKYNSRHNSSLERGINFNNFFIYPFITHRQSNPKQIPLSFIAQAFNEPEGARTRA